MKLVTFTDGQGYARGGALSQDGNGVIPLSALDRSLDSVQALIDGGPALWDRIRDALVHAAPSVALADVKLLAPLPRPIQVRDVLCFLDHLRNVGRTAARMMGTDPDHYEFPRAFETAPRYYKANRMCVIGTETDVIWPTGCNLLDFELELGIVIGREGKDIAHHDARSHIFGYTVFNDVSARDLQVEEMESGLGPAKGKDFDTGNVLGPCVTTADELDPDDLTMIARLNGEELVRGNTRQMDHKVEDIIVHVSRNETIFPGEVLGSGTVPLGCLMEHGRQLSAGDVVELEIEGIGVLRNRFVLPS